MKLQKGSFSYFLEHLIRFMSYGMQEWDDYAKRREEKSQNLHSRQKQHHINQTVDHSVRNKIDDVSRNPQIITLNFQMNTLPNTSVSQTSNNFLFL